MPSPSHLLQHNACRRGFTLAELLAVIIIMSLLMVAVVPSITGMTRGASLRGATMQVQTTLVAARQNAISRRANVSVLFPSPGMGSSPLSKTDPKNFRAIAAYATSSTGNWYCIGWEFLPPGIVFRPNNFAATDLVTAPTDGANVASMYALMFNRLGERTGLSTGNSAATVQLMEGFVDTSVGAIVPKGKAGGTNQISVLYPAGIIQVKRL